MNPSLINWLAVVAAALSGFVVGGIWYSPILFANAWMADSNITKGPAVEQSKDIWLHYIIFTHYVCKPGRVFGNTRHNPCMGRTSRLFGRHLDI